ncbi:transglutaminaseTgpA domain-containing protein [Streptomyces sp. NPDC006879]|uniref:transglutaminase family protein n=1 Tax=Streptomyces sp. NPDC006879 TaxID=3364767 RepID=UPI0036C0F74C
MSSRAKLALSALTATLLTACALLPLVHPASWLVQAALLLGAQSLVGALTRRVPLARSLTVAAQLTTSILLLTVVFAAGPAIAWFLPGPEALARFADLLDQGTADVSHYAIPAPLTDGIRLLLLAGVLLIGLLVDLIAVTFRSAAGAGLPLLALYSIAAGMSRGGASWLWFLLAASGYLLLLLAEGRERLSQWGRVFSGAQRSTGMRPSGRSSNGPLAPVRAGRRIGAVALGIALVVPAVLPAMEAGYLPGRTANGEGGTGGTITAVNPLVSLQNSLNVPEDREVIRYRTDSQRPQDQYLRIVALDEFDGSAWRTSERRVTDVPSALPLPEGLSPAVRSTEITSTISASGWYGQTYLPMPYPATAVDIDGRWRFEPTGRTLVGDRRQTTRGARYTVRSLQLEPTAAQLAGAPQAGPVLLREYTKVPPSLPGIVRSTALKVTEGSKNDYTRAVKLQDWFASNGGFTYDTEVSSGTGASAISNFLRAKEGFCVHFAFSMAAMARTLDIPARVAVGFTAGTRRADGSMSVGLRDAHAWPELYFEGVGWTRFEPTPSRGSSPQYTRPELPSTNTPSNPDAELPGRSAAPVPAPSRSSGCVPQLERTGDCDAATPQSVGEGPGGGQTLTKVLWATGSALLLLLVPLTPVLWRSRVRSRRLASGRVLSAWRELQDAAWDIGIAPDQALSPRMAARRIVGEARLSEEASQAVHRVATAVETVLYAPEPVRPTDLAGDVRLASAAFLAPLSRTERWRVLLAPRSAVRVLWALSARSAALGRSLVAQRSRG